MRSSLALTSVDRITSTIKSTLQKGNTLIRADTHQRSRAEISSPKQKQIFIETVTTDGGISAVTLFEKIKPHVSSSQKGKKNIINILNFAQMKWQQFCAIANKTGLNYNEYLDKFKKIDFKLNGYLNDLAVGDDLEQISNIKLQLKRIIQFLNQRARKYIDKNRQITNLIKKKDKEEFQEQCQQQAIKEEMLELLDRLKGQAINMGSDLKKDNVVISQIHSKQDKQLNLLNNKSKNLQEMMNSQKMGFFKLISYAGIGIVVWIFTLLFILIF